MDDQQYFLVLQNVGPSLETDSSSIQTFYPEVHYVFADDAFSPELDALERQPGDISVLCDLNESGCELLGCQSISPEWQVTDASLAEQALDVSSVTSASQHNSKLLKINGMFAKQNQEIVSLRGDFDSQMNIGFALIEQSENRQRHLRKAVASFASESAKNA